MKGFKSFANRTKIDFDNRITAIVGPNGSGKSNISDAVKWVLGEQSIKSLRGKKMPDVIFSGGENSKAQNLAQVDLVFSNEDKTLNLPYDKVKISRRIYRNGDNEYKINGKKVRLKDVKELFLDTGIGKEGYSVIGQGRIDEIINSSAKERRAIFEEASGISKHKYRRDESIKKLEKVSENLEVIEREWDYKKREVSTLKVQKENFERNKKLTEDLDTKTYFYFHNKSASLIKKSKDLKETIKSLEEMQITKNKDLEDLNKKLLPFKEELESLEEKLNNTGHQIQALEKSIENNKIKAKLDSQDLSYKNKDFKRNLDDKKLNIEKKEKLEEEIRLGEKSLAETDKNLEDNKNTLDKKEKLANTLEDKIEGNKIKVKNLDFEKKALDKKIYDYDLNEKTQVILSKKREEEEKKIKEKANDLAFEIKTIENQILSLEEELKEKKESFTKEEKENASYDQALENLNTSYNQKRESLNSNNISLKEELANLKIQKEILERNEGYFYPVQEFLRESKNSSMDNLYLDTLANLINVKNGYEEVIEILMGSALQNIVTRTKEDTRQLINLINKKKLGRITFLPLDSIKSFRKQRPNQEEVIAMAYDLVKYNEALTAIINQFLGSTVVVKNIDAAISLSKKIRGYRIITLDLDLINTWGSMVAGKNSQKKSKLGIINRSKKIEELKNKILFLKDKNKEINNDLAKIETRIKDHKKNLDQSSQNLLSLKDSIQNLEADLRHKNFEKESLKNRKSELLETLGKSALENNNQDIGSVRKKLAETEENIAMYDKALKNDNKELIETNSAIIKIKNQIDILTRDKNLFLNTLAEKKANLNNLIESNRFGDKINISLKKEIEDLEISIKNSEKKTLREEELLKKQKEEMTKLKSEINEKSKANIDMVARVKTLEKELGDISIDLVKQDYKLQTYQKDIGNLSDEIGPFLSRPIDQIENLSKDKKYTDVVKQDLINIQKEINKVGFFTDQSLNDYQAAAKDFDFLDKQKKDLETSRDDITKMIKKLESEMKDEFIKNFKIIDEKFQRIFETLFMGGKAKLSLDEEDELTCGIEIMACPPGKSSKSISLLSGGEKALTAVALLFALFETNPAPFSLLDEIDAALDEANIKRYIDYLKSLSDKTQFIMITHRQTTMQLAERIHGVTIGDDGISKVYSIDFDEN